MVKEGLTLDISHPSRVELTITVADQVRHGTTNNKRPQGRSSKESLEHRSKQQVVVNRLSHCRHD